jgi:anthranilate synthase/aminodeoxychorismate synthase-like glutamine amidotransferase
MVLLIDNYDSFVFNLYQYLGELGEEPVVYRNDAITVEQIEALAPSHILISPGPCTPLEAGVSNDVLQRLAGRVPILGVCLGHQCMGHVFGGRVIRAPRVMHGKTSLIHHTGVGVFRGLPSPFRATRYHSLIIERATIPDCLEITAQTEDGIIMGVRHRDFPDCPVEGVQFHPEAILTTAGYDLLRNFLEYRRPEH